VNKHKSTIIISEITCIWKNHFTNCGQQTTPVILTDSRAKYIIEHCYTEIESQIRWRDKSGQSTEKGYNWLQKNIEKEIGHLDNIHIFGHNCHVSIFVEF
jgi:hypothetical protein